MDRGAELRKRLGDWAPPIALAIAAAHELAYDHLGVADWVLAQGLAWSLLPRRRFPLATLALTMAVALVCWLRHDLFTSYASVLFALHTVAARRPRRTALLAGLVVEAGAVLAAWRFAPTGSVNDGVLLLTALVLTFLLLGTTQYAQRRYLEVLEERASQLERERDQQAQLSAAEERARIARELHDVVAHSVSVMVALSEGAAVKTRTDVTQAHDTMRQVAGTGRAALAELRKVVSVLREDGSRAPQPTLAALPSLVEDVSRAGLPVELTVTGPASELPETIQLCVYRIVQESLTNTLKHASAATRAQVTVAVSPAQIQFSVRDDGRPVPVPEGIGNGIRGMRERAEMYGGTVTAGWSEQGWSVTGVLDR